MNEMLSSLMQAIKGKKQQTLHTALLIFITTHVFTNYGELEKRGEWMKYVNKHIVLFEDHIITCQSNHIEMDKRITKLETKKGKI